MRGVSFIEQAGRRMRCLRKFIFSVQRTKKPQQAESRPKPNSHSTVPSKKQEHICGLKLLKNLVIEFASLVLGGCEKPHVNVGAAGAVFVNVDADHPFAHGIGARENQSSAESESCFRE